MNFLSILVATSFQIQELSWNRINIFNSILNGAHVLRVQFNVINAITDLPF